MTFMKAAFFLTLLVPCLGLADVQTIQVKQAKVQDAKNVPLKKKAPPKDPKLASYYINLKTSPRAAKAEPVETTLPLKLEKGDRICFIGNLLLDAERRYGHLETLIHQHHPKHELTVRNLAWPADEVDLMPRPDNFGDLDQHLTYFKADVIIAAYGYNESFAGEEGLPAFKKRLDKFLIHLKSQAYNGKSAPRIVLISPTGSKGLAGEANNGRIESYASVMKEVAEVQKVGFVDAFDKFIVGINDSEAMTMDGHQLTSSGHHNFSIVVSRALFGKNGGDGNEPLRQTRRR